MFASNDRSNVSRTLTLASVVTLIPSVFLMIFITPRLLTVVGKGRLDGVKPTPVFLLKMFAVLAAFAVQLGILIKVISDSDLYGSSSILSTAIYLASLVRISLLFSPLVSPMSSTSQQHYIQLFVSYEVTLSSSHSPIYTHHL